MDRDERLDRHIKIFIRIAGPLFLPHDDPIVLPLGAEYAANMSRLLKKCSLMFADIKRDLSSFSDVEILEGFNPDGQPLTERAKDLIAGHKRKVVASFGGLQTWYTAPLFRTNELADFEYWRRSDFLSIDEIVWLSVGLEPSHELIEAIKPFDARGSQQRLDPVATYIGRHKEIIRRKFDPHDYYKKPEFDELLAWINQVSLDVHPKFYRIIDRKNGADEVSQDLDSQPIAKGDIDGRERVSMVKLIAAMAIDGYGFDPTARRSDIPNEIQGIADRLGLELTPTTIRKYLREGAELLPEDWEPE